MFFQKTVLVQIILSSDDESLAHNASNTEQNLSSDDETENTGENLVIDENTDTT